MKMIDAKQARTIAEAKNAETVEELRYIEIQIKQAAKNEQFECWINRAIRDSTRRELISLGYIVDVHDDQRDGYSIRISWKLNDRA